MSDMQIPERIRATAPESRALVVAPGFHSAQGFELLQREARAFMSSSMVPVTFRQWSVDKETGQMIEAPEALSNCIIALNMAIRMHADPLMVMQNLYIVHGMPAWSAKFLIGLFNTCGRFSTIRYAFSEKRDSCFAHCRELSTGERIEGPSVSLAMAKAEGWSLRKGNKWVTMPEIMLTNRAASFLIRTTAPELSLGLPMREEAEDVIDVESREMESAPTPLQTVRDLLRDSPSAPVVPPSPEPTAPPTSEAEPSRAVPPPEPASDTLPPDVDYPLGQQPPPPVSDNSEGIAMIEPKVLPVKDGELTQADADRRTKIKLADAPAKQAPAFNVDVYARRIRAIADVDMLTLMREEITSLPPSLEREDLMTMIDSRLHELIPNEGNDNDHA